MYSLQNDFTLFYRVVLGCRKNNPNVKKSWPDHGHVTSDRGFVNCGTPPSLLITGHMIWNILSAHSKSFYMRRAKANAPNILANINPSIFFFRSCSNVVWSFCNASRDKPSSHIFVPIYKITPNFSVELLFGLLQCCKFRFVILRNTINMGCIRRLHLPKVLMMNFIR